MIIPGSEILDSSIGLVTFSLISSPLSDNGKLCWIFPDEFLNEYDFSNLTCFVSPVRPLSDGRKDPPLAKLLFGGSCNEFWAN